MEKITPVELRGLEFKKVLRGYEPKEVKLYIERAADELERLLLENQKLKEKLSNYEKMENDIKSAQEAVKIKIAEGEKQAKEIVKKAVEESEQLKKDFEEIKKSKNEFISEFKKLLINYLNMLPPIEEKSIEAEKEQTQVNE